MPNFKTSVSLNIEVSRSGPDFVVRALGQEGKGTGITGALSNLGEALYKRRNALGKVATTDLSEGGLADLNRLEEVLGPSRQD